MPYLILGNKPNYILILKKNHKILGHHKTLASAKKQIAAIEINKLKKYP